MTLASIWKQFPKTINNKAFKTEGSRIETGLKTAKGTKLYRLRLQTPISPKTITFIYQPPFTVYVTDEYHNFYLAKTASQSRTVDNIVKVTDRTMSILSFMLKNARIYKWRRYKQEHTFLIREPSVVVLLAKALNLDAVMWKHMDAAIIKANDAYHTSGKSLLTDEEYDAWEAFYVSAKRKWPLKNKVGTGKVDKLQRGDKKKLPVPMGSLEKLFAHADIKKWADKNGIDKLTGTPKLDGISCLLEYKHGLLTEAYKRGDGVEGISILPQIKAMKDVPKEIGLNEHIGISAEIAMTNSDFEKYSKDKGGKYKNPRNMVAGIFNRSGVTEETKQALKDCKVFAYKIREIGEPEDLSKTEMLSLLAKLGFKRIPSFSTTKTGFNDDKLEELLSTWKDEYDVDMDGIVFDATDSKTRNKLGTETNSLNPRYARAWKPANIGVRTRVINVEWNVSRHGVLKPIVHVEPVKLSGVTVRKATGHNAGNIRDKGIGPGALIEIYRSGDVIPYIDKVIKKVTPQLPSEPYTWNETKVDAIADGETDQENIESLVHFFKVLGIEYFSKKTISKLYENGIDSPAKIFKLGAKGLAKMERMGEKAAAKVFNQLDKLKQGVPAYKLMYALSTFGSNFGSTKLKAIVERFGNPKSVHPAMIAAMPGFSNATAKTFVAGMPSYLNQVRELEPYIKPIYTKPKAAGNKMAGKVVVFTGVRDSNVSEWIENQGGKVGSGVSSNTSILISADPSTLKSQKARDLGVTVVSLEQFKKKYM